jgi:hypothetical protein
MAVIRRRSLICIINRRPRSRTGEYQVLCVVCCVLCVVCCVLCVVCRLSIRRREKKEAT